MRSARARPETPRPSTAIALIGPRPSAAQASSISLCVKTRRQRTFSGLARPLSAHQVGTGFMRTKRATRASPMPSANGAIPGALGSKSGLPRSDGFGGPPQTASLSSVNPPHTAE